LTPKNFGQTRQAPSSSTVSSPKTTRRLVRHATLCSPEQLDGAGYQARIYRWSNHKAPSKRRGSRWTNRAVRGWRLYASRACNYRRSWRAGFDFVELWRAPVCCRLDMFGGRCRGLISIFFIAPTPRLTARSADPRRGGATETGSLVTPSSSGESGANLIFGANPIDGISKTLAEATFKDWSCHAGPMVRIRLPPARSLRTISTEAAKQSAAGGRQGIV
jgi:hypothetical protein